jgi:zinc transporter 9
LNLLVPLHKTSPTDLPGVLRLQRPLVATGNQLLLRLGISRSLKAPTSEYPYGYLKEKFVFSLISAVGVFCIGAGASLINGAYAILDTDHDVDNFGLNFAVLAISFFVEGFSCYVAVRMIAAGALARGVSFFEHLDSSADPAAVAVMAEDGAAVIGVTIAAISTGLVRITGFQAWDGIGSIFVGVLLALVALFLIQRNRSMLVGRSMQPDDFNRVVSRLLEDPVVHHVYDARSEEIGPGVYRFSADIDFHGDVIVSRYLNTVDVPALQRKFLRAHNATDVDTDEESTRAFQAMLKEHGARIVQAVGAEVDHLEGEIQRLVPGVRYVDLEADRGRFWLYRASMDGGDYGNGLWQAQFDGSQWARDNAVGPAALLSDLPGSARSGNSRGRGAAENSGAKGAEVASGTDAAVVPSVAEDARVSCRERIGSSPTSASIRKQKGEHQSLGAARDAATRCVSSAYRQKRSEEDQASEWSIDTYIDASLDAWLSPSAGENHEEVLRESKQAEGPAEAAEVESRKSGGRSEQRDSTPTASAAPTAVSALEAGKARQVAKAIPGAPRGSLVVKVDGNANGKVAGVSQPRKPGPDGQKGGARSSGGEVATRAQCGCAVNKGGLLSPTGGVWGSTGHLRARAMKRDISGQCLSHLPLQCQMLGSVCLRLK